MILANETKWTNDDKENAEKIELDWSILAMVVEGHALQIMLQVSSESPRMAWDDSRRRLNRLEFKIFCCFLKSSTNWSWSLMDQTQSIRSKNSRQTTASKV